MINKLSYGARRNILIIFTGITLSYVRNYVQYKTYCWNSVTIFISSSFAHYIIILLIGAVSCVVSNSKKIYFMGQDDSVAKHEVDVYEFLYYFCVAILISCIFVFFIGHYTPGDSYDD